MAMAIVARRATMTDASHWKSTKPSSMAGAPLKLAKAFSASAALAWIFFDGMRGHKPSALGACVGAVVGLVAITPAAGYVSVGASIFIGSDIIIRNSTTLT